jgi:ribokinase
LGSSPPRIVVVGSANVDLLTFIDRVPGPGETIFGSQFDLGWGGKGANQAVAARLCGADVHMVGRVGDDLFGPATIENFKAQGIGTEHMRIVPGASSGVAPIFVEPNGQNRIVVVKGANDRLLPSDVDEALPLLQSAGCIVLQLEVPVDTVYHTLRIANRFGITCLLNPAPAQPLDIDIVALADYFIPNEPEAETISGMNVRSVDEAKACAVALLARGLKRVIITLGEKGALLATANGVELVPGFKVATKDTTGAGDAFTGSFAVFLAEGLPERDAIAHANLYAALSTIGVGTQKSFVDRARFNREWAAVSPAI